MILYDFRCRDGHRFEAAVESMTSENPPCAVCGETTSRAFSRVNIGNSADAGPTREEMPHSWESIGRGHPDAVRHWRKKIEKREKLEERHPELAGDRRPVLAHEGIFAGSPLRAGDDVAASVDAALKRSGSPESNGTDEESSSAKGRG